MFRLQACLCDLPFNQSCCGLCPAQVGADGVHVGQGDIPAAVVRRMIGPWMLLGVSAKTEAEAVQAAKDGADYVGVGAGARTPSDPKALAFVCALRHACVAMTRDPVHGFAVQACVVECCSLTPSAYD